MGGRLLWTGLTVVMAGPVVHIPQAQMVGAILMGIGCVLMWLDR